MADVYHGYFWGWLDYLEFLHLCLIPSLENITLSANQSIWLVLVLPHLWFDSGGSDL